MAFRIDMGPLERSSMNTARGFGTIGGLIKQGIEGRKREQEMKDMEALGMKAMSGDAEALNALYSKDPKAGQFIEQRLNLQGQKEQEQEDRLTSQKAMDTADFVEQMHLAPQEAQEGMFNEGVKDPRYDIDEEDRPHFMNPNARRALVGKVKGEDYAKSFFGGESGGESLPAETVGFNKLIEGFSPKEKADARRIKAGLKGRAMSNAMTTALDQGSIEEFKKASADLKQAEKFGAMTGASRAKAIDKGFDSIVKIDNGIRNIDKAINAISSGAGVGAVEKLWPSIKASSVELDNIRGQMALDVVGATTFGALSKGELDLAKDIALPTGLDSKELTAYLERKRTAQEKLRGYYNEQIQHLDQGGTVASFLRMKERGAGNQNTTQAGGEIPQSLTFKGKTYTQEDIKETARMHGMTEQDVVNKLRQSEGAR